MNTTTKSVPADLSEQEAVLLDAYELADYRWELRTTRRVLDPLEIFDDDTRFEEYYEKEEYEEDLPSITDLKTVLDDNFASARQIGDIFVTNLTPIWFQEHFSTDINILKAVLLTDFFSTFTTHGVGRSDLIKEIFLPNGEALVTPFFGYDIYVERAFTLLIDRDCTDELVLTKLERAQLIQAMLDYLLKYSRKSSFNPEGSWWFAWLAEAITIGTPETFWDLKTTKEFRDLFSKFVMDIREPLTSYYPKARRSFMAAIYATYKARGVTDRPYEAIDRVCFSDDERDHAYAYFLYKPSFRRLLPY